MTKLPQIHIQEMNTNTNANTNTSSLDKKISAGDFSLLQQAAQTSAANTNTK